MRLQMTVVGVCILAGCSSDITPGVIGTGGAPGSAQQGGAVGSGGVASLPSGATGGSPSGVGTSAATGASGSGATPMGPGGASPIGSVGSMGGALPTGGTSGTFGGMPNGGMPSGGAPSGGGTSNGGSSGAGGGPEEGQLAITADFLNQTLSIVDVAKLMDGGKRSDALVGSVDFSKYAPGPLDLAITPDGKTALVSVSGGWLSAFVTVPPGNGTLVFVDIPTRTVTGELYTGASPMGIAITKDGKRAFVGQYSETYIAVVDIAARTFTKLQTGNQFNEEVAIDDGGEVGILSYGPAGNCFTFSVADPAGQQGATLALTGDAGGTAFFPGTKFAYVVQAPTALTGNVGGHDVIDVTNPKAPVASDDVRIPGSPTWYPVTPVAARKSVAFPSTANNMLSVVEMKLDGSTAKQVQSVTVGAASTLAYGLSADASGRVYVAVPKEHYVAVVDLATAKSFMVPWELTQSGPNDIKLVPR